MSIALSGVEFPEAGLPGILGHHCASQAPLLFDLRGADTFCGINGFGRFVFHL